MTPTLDREGRSPLHYAAMANDASEVRSLIAAGADPNCGDRMGFSPLHFAAQSGATDAAMALIEEGAEVDRVNAYGNTPLSVAVFNSKGRGDLIALLRALGADPLARNKSGQTPVGLARLIGTYDVSQYFADPPE